MKRLALKFPNWARAVFSLSLLLSLVTGLLWFCLGRWGQVEGEFGPEKHPWLASLAKLHGAGAFIAMISFGMVLAGHVPVAWRTKWSRRSGMLTVAVIWISIFTAYGLYYSGDDALREKLVWIHLGSGMAIPISIVGHIWSGRRRARKKGHDSRPLIISSSS